MAHDDRHKQQEACPEGLEKALLTILKPSSTSTQRKLLSGEQARSLDQE